MKKLLIGLLLAAALIGCSNSTVPTQKSNLTVGMIKSKVVEGETTQNDILRIFGAPNMVTKNKYGEEVWSYNKMSTEGSAKESGWSLLLVGGGSAVNSSTTSSFDFIVNFDEFDIVRNYSIISSSY